MQHIRVTAQSIRENLASGAKWKSHAQGLLFTLLAPPNCMHFMSAINEMFQHQNITNMKYKKLVQELEQIPTVEAKPL